MNQSKAITECICNSASHKSKSEAETQNVNKLVTQESENETIMHINYEKENKIYRWW